MNGVLGSSPGWRWGNLLPDVGYGRCYACHRPWWAITPRVVNFGLGQGQFALCEPCWTRSSTAERLAAHRWLTVRTCPSKWDQIRHAIEELDWAFLMIRAVEVLGDELVKMDAEIDAEIASLKRAAAVPGPDVSRLQAAVDALLARDVADPVRMKKTSGSREADVDGED